MNCNVIVIELIDNKLLKYYRLILFQPGNRNEMLSQTVVNVKNERNKFKFKAGTT